MSRTAASFWEPFITFHSNYNLSGETRRLRFCKINLYIKFCSPHLNQILHVLRGSEQTSLELRLKQHKQLRVKPLTRPSGISSPAPPVYVPGDFEQDIRLGAFYLVCSALYNVNILYLSVAAYESYSYSCKETIKYLVNEHNQSSCLYESEGNHRTLVRRLIKTPWRSLFSLK